MMQTRTKPLSLLIVMLLLLPLGVHAQDEDSVSVEVQAAGEWQDTSLYVEAGQTIQIRYQSGEWRNFPQDAFHDANGGASFICCGESCVEPVPCQPKGGLIGRIGPDGVAFWVGNTLDHVAQTSGNLYLRMNDVGTYDNEGSITVSIQGHQPSNQDDTVTDDDAVLRVLFTSHLSGHLRPERADNDTLIGGMGFASVLISDERATYDNLLLVDTGSTLFGTPFSDQTNGTLMLNVMSQLEYDAWLPGAIDLTTNLFPAPAFTVLTNYTGGNLGAAPVLYPTEDRSIAVLGLLPVDATEDASDPITALQGQMDALAETVVTVVVLSRLDAEANRQLINRVDGIDLVLSPQPLTDDVPASNGQERLNDTLLVMPAMDYRYLGLLTLRFSEPLSLDELTLRPLSGTTLPTEDPVSEYIERAWENFSD